MTTVRPSRKRIRAANEELIKLGVVVDSGKPLNGRIVWLPNPKLTEEQELTEEQRKALIDSDCEDADLREKLEDAPRFINIDSMSEEPVLDVCHHCGQPSNQYHPVGPIIVGLSDPDGNDETHVFCEWRCLAHWAAMCGGGHFIETTATARRALASR